MPTFAWPIEAYAYRHGKYGPRHISSDFGPRDKPCSICSKYHQGIDIGVQTGTPVLATADGVVRLIKENSNTAGTYVVVEHDDGYWSRYLHLSAYEVAVGDPVRKAQIIASSGGDKGAWGAGSSQGAHLHFEIWQGEPKKSGSTPIDPETLLTEEMTGISRQQAVAMGPPSSVGGGKSQTLTIVASLSAAAAAFGIFFALRARAKKKSVPALVGNPRKRRRARRKRSTR